MQTHDHAERLRIPIAAEYVKQGGIDNRAVTRPKVTIQATTSLSPYPGSG